MGHDIRRIVDLDDRSQRAAFDAFVPIYEAGFPRDDEREDPASWNRRLAERQNAPANTILLLAFDEAGEQAIGGALLEYLPRSRAGMLAYIVVAEGRRTGGVARALLDEGASALRARAEAEGAGLRALFAETEDPRGDDAGDMLSDDDRDLRFERLAIHAALGARWIDVPYVQPPVSDRTGPVGMMLIAFPALAGGPAHVMDLVVVRDFIDESYDEAGGGMEKARAAIKRRLWAEARYAEGGRAADGDDHARAVDNAGEEERFILLRPMPARETPRLAFARVAIALHCVSIEIETTPDGGERHADAAERGRRALGRHRLWRGADAPVTRAGAEPEHFCPLLNSFERDMLIYTALERPPVVSVCALAAPVAIELHFPESTEFLSEGRATRWLEARTPVAALLNLTFSRFPDSGVRVWHVALRPAPGGHFTELDLVKLITLYDGTQENVPMVEALEVGRAGGERRPFAELLFELSGGALVDARFVGGAYTIDLAALADGEACVEAIRHVAETGALPKPRPEHLDALAAPVQGIFDYARIGDDELASALTPNLDGAGLWRTVNCATLASYEFGDDMIDVAAETSGVSPYLLIVAAVALQQEFVGRVAERHLDSVAGDSFRLRGMTRAYGAAQTLLRRFAIPDVFVYREDSELLARLREHRGAGRYLAATEAKLDELEKRIEMARGFLIEIALGLFSMLAIFELLSYFRDEGWITTGWTIGLGIGALGLTMITLFLLRPRRYAPGTGPR